MLRVRCSAPNGQVKGVIMPSPRYAEYFDEPYHRFIEPMGALTIAFAQADSALFWLLTAVMDGGEHDAHKFLSNRRKPEEIIDVIAKCKPERFGLASVYDDVISFDEVKDARNKYIHAEWYVAFDEDPQPSVGLRKLPRKAPKKPDNLFPEHSDANIETIWSLVQDLMHCAKSFEGLTYQLHRERYGDPPNFIK